MPTLQELADKHAPERGAFAPPAPPPGPGEDVTAPDEEDEGGAAPPYRQEAVLEMIEVLATNGFLMNERVASELGVLIERLAEETLVADMIERGGEQAARQVFGEVVVDDYRRRVAEYEGSCEEVAELNDEALASPPRETPLERTTRHIITVIALHEMAEGLPSGRALEWCKRQHHDMMPPAIYAIRVDENARADLVSSWLEERRRAAKEALEPLLGTLLARPFQEITHALGLAGEWIGEPLGRERVEWFNREWARPIRGGRVTMYEAPEVPLSMVEAKRSLEEEEEELRRRREAGEQVIEVKLGEPEDVECRDAGARRGAFGREGEMEPVGEDGGEVHELPEIGDALAASVPGAYR